LRHIPRADPAHQAVLRMADHVGQPPNIDAALAVLAHYLAAPPDAPLLIFAIGRVAGWIAHACEQASSGTMIRPRARYQPADMPAPDP